MRGYFRIAPGIKLSARGSGIGIGIGPRAFRVWLGTGGGVGVSSGVGPLSFYRSLGPVGGDRYRPSPQKVQRLQEIGQAAANLEAMLSLHRRVFPPAQPPQAPPAAPVDVGAFEQQRRSQLLKGIGFFQFSARRKGKAQARILAFQDAERERARREAARVDHQRYLDELWGRLLANDPEVVLPTLEAAFSDNQAPAVAVDCEEAGVTVVVQMEGLNALPERVPALTPTGRPTLRLLTKTERNELYVQWMSSNVLATVREALAVAPGLEEVLVAVLRKDGVNAFGEPMLSPVYVGTFSRAMCDRIDWDLPGALDAIFHAEDVAVSLKGRTKELAALDPSRYPGLDEVLSEVQRAFRSPPEETSQESAR